MASEISTDLALADRESPGLKAARAQFLDDMADMAAQYTAAVLSDGTPAAYKGYFDVMSKFVPGAAADPKNRYDNIPTIHINFGDGFSTKVIAAPAPEPAAKPLFADIEDAQVKVVSTEKPKYAVPELDEVSQELADLFQVKPLTESDFDEFDALNLTEALEFPDDE